MAFLKKIGSAFSEVFGAIPYETPKYTVLHKVSATSSFPAFEIRQYSASVVAEVSANDVPGRTEQFNNTAFRILARYIGVFSTPENTTANGAEAVSMTSPVTMSSVKSSPEAISMTSPVTMSSNQPNSKQDWTGTMRFILPSKYASAKDAPTPSNPAIKIKDLPAHTEAVIRFSGSMNQEAALKHKEQLVAAITHTSKSLSEVDSEAKFSLAINYSQSSSGSSEDSSSSEGPQDAPFSTYAYNAPFCLPFCRTNEVAIPVHFKQ